MPANFQTHCLARKQPPMRSLQTACKTLECQHWSDGASMRVRQVYAKTLALRKATKKKSSLEGYPGVMKRVCATAHHREDADKSYIIDI
jgi:hypothetical protein